MGYARDNQLVQILSMSQMLLWGVGAKKNVPGMFVIQISGVFLVHSDERCPSPVVNCGLDLNFLEPDRSPVQSSGWEQNQTYGPVQGSEARGYHWTHSNLFRLVQTNVNIIGLVQNLLTQLVYFFMGMWQENICLCWAPRPKDETRVGKFLLGL